MAARRGPLCCTHAHAGADVVAFYASPEARRLYRTHLRALASRVNTMTGLPYNEVRARLT